MRAGLADSGPDAGFAGLAAESSEPAAIENSGEDDIFDSSIGYPDPNGGTSPVTSGLRSLGGQTAADTSAVISAAAFPTTSNWVVVARDDDFADAMSATGLAGVLQAPIVLTDRTGLSKSAHDEIVRLDALACYVIGGPGAVSNQVVADLEALGLHVERVYGNDYYDTSVACARYIAAWCDELGLQTKNAVVAYGQNFQDALSMSAFAYAYHAPIFLTMRGATAADRDLPSEAYELLGAGGAYEGVTQMFVAGGTGAVSAQIDEAVKTNTRTVVRLWGEDGYDTSNQIATYMRKKGLLTGKAALVACGDLSAKGVDALSGAALAGRLSSPLLLVNGNARMGLWDRVTLEGADSEGTKAYLQTAATSHTLSGVYALGGTYVMPQSTYALLADTVGMSFGDGASITAVASGVDYNTWDFTGDNLPETLRIEQKSVFNGVDATVYINGKNVLEAHSHLNESAVTVKVVQLVGAPALLYIYERGANLTGNCAIYQFSSGKDELLLDAKEVFSWQGLTCGRPRAADVISVSHDTLTISAGNTSYALGNMAAQVRYQYVAGRLYRTDATTGITVGELPFSKGVTYTTLTTSIDLGKH